MLFDAWRFILAGALGSSFWFSANARAVTLENLRHDPALSPRNFAQYFANFRFCFHAEVQSPQIFLSTQSGDCDDYATLAATVLKEKGFTPRLLSVRMKREVHVICYIEEARAYLDYNKRNCRDGLVSCGHSLSEIADVVSASFCVPWSSISEFTFRDGSKRLVQTTLPENAGSLPQTANAKQRGTSWTVAGTPSRTRR